MDTLIYIDPQIMKLSFKEFEKYHEKFLSHDTMTAKDRWRHAGGIVPDEGKKPEKVG